MQEKASRLREALVAAFRPYLEDRLGERFPACAAAVGEGETWLGEQLDRLLELPFASQPRVPLELFQEATSFPTRALQAASHVPTRRDPVTENALPGDIYGLAPASSFDLGEEVWQAHLAWGAAKAQSHLQSTLVIVSRNLLDRSRIEESARAGGFAVSDWKASAPLKATVATVDLTHPEAEAAIRGLAGGGVKVIAYGPHVDAAALERARQLGATEALPRSRFFAGIGDWLAGGG